MSARHWSGGRGAIRRPKRWRCVVGSCWRAPRAPRTRASARSLMCIRRRCRKWRLRFAEDRLDGLVDAPRPGAVRTIGDDVVEAVVLATLETAPPDATHWS